MKKLVLFLLLACAQLASAQTPQAISYQAIARDANGKPMPNADVTVEFSVLDGSVSGQAVYRERHQTETNPFGLFTLEIGRGTVVSGSFAGIDWGGGAKFMRVEINGTLQGTTQLLAVPYALFAEKTKSSQSLDVPGAQAGQVLKWDATAQKWLPANDEVGPPNSGLTSVATAAPISGDGTTGNPVTLAAGSIGSGQIIDNSITINDLAPGVIPTVPASLPPSGAAGGDLTGNYPAPTVAKIQGRAVDNAAPATGQVLKWDGSKWTPQNDIGGGMGDNWGSQTTQTDATLAGDGTTGNPLKIAPQGAATNQFLKWNGSAWLPADVTVSIGNSTINSNQIIDNSITINDLAPGVIPTVAAGAGISVAQNGSTFTVTNAAPNLPISLTGAGATTVTGAYPNFTVTTPAPEDNSVTNEIQVLTLSSDTLKLSSGGGSVKLPGSAGWNLTGNGGTDPTDNFIGTTDDVPISFRVGGVERMKLWENGRLELFHNENTFIGQSTGKSNIGGDANTAIGSEAFYSNIGGSGNTVIGKRALYSNTTGGANTAIGLESLYSNINGYSNTAIGWAALYSNTAGNANTAIGIEALKSNTMGNANTAIGIEALKSNTMGSGNIAIGVEALKSNTIGSGNIAIGESTLLVNTIGNYNTANGTGALSSNKTGYYNTANGSSALALNTTGNSNVALGKSALYSNTTSSNLVAVGDSALYSNTSGIWNTAIGSKALWQNTTGNNNTAVGDRSLESNTDGTFNTANGSDALKSNTTGRSNTAVGHNSLNRNTSGNDNTAVGQNALFSNLTGSENTGIGRFALESNTTGYAKTAVGYRALRSNTTGVANTALGVDALAKNVTGGTNTAIGYKALENCLGNSNTAIGSSALDEVGNFVSNTAVGIGALGENTGGNENTAVGRAALINNTSGDLNTAIGADAGPVLGNLTNTIAIGEAAAVSSSNSARIGNAFITSIGGQVGWTNLSDSRIKTHITENIPGLAFIQRLRPVSYRYDIHRQNELAGIVDTAQWEGKYDIEKIQFSGFLAQEVEQAAREVGYDFSGVDAPKNERSLYGLRYAEFTVPLVKAVQEQQQIIEAQRQQLEAQDKVLGEVLARLSALEAAARVAEKPENR